MQVKAFGQVIGGYLFRGKIEADDTGDICVFQAKDLIEGENIENTSHLTKVSHKILKHPAFLKNNDILLVSRGMRSGSFRSTVFICSATNVIASSSLHVIRIKSTEVLPEYVSRYLNSKDGQDALSKIVSGSYIGALPRKGVEEIKIPIPTLEKQQMIIALDKNLRKQEQIINRKNEIKRHLINASFTSLAAK